MQRFIFLRSLAALPTVLLVTVLGLSVNPAVKAQLSFTVDNFTPNNLTITFQSGPTLTGTAPTNAASILTLFDGDNVNNGSWLNVNGLFGGDVTTANLGTATFDGNFVDATAGYITFTMTSNPSFGDTFTNDYTVSFSGSNAFIPGNVSHLSLYWGDISVDNTAVLQSTVATSAVPEPSTYAAIFGVAALGFTAYRRRRAHA